MILCLQTGNGVSGGWSGLSSITHAVKSCEFALEAGSLTPSHTRLCLSTSLGPGEDHTLPCSPSPMLPCTPPSVTFLQPCTSPVTSKCP